MKTLILELQKNNLGEAGLEIQLHWDPEHQLFVGQPKGRESFEQELERDGNDRDEILSALRGCEKSKTDVPKALTGPRTAFKVLSARPEMRAWWRAKKGAKRRFDMLFEQLLASRDIEVEQYINKQRKPAERVVAKSKGVR